jgi:predicted lipid-binding transport protein (Tim44 family)
MDDGSFFLDIILLAMVAAFIFFRLRGVLGKRMGHEQQPREEITRKPYSDPKDHQADDEPDNVVPMNDRIEFERDPLPADTTPLGQTLRQMHEIDRSFQGDIFASQAEAAYEAIVMSFAEGDRGMLKDLLSEEVYRNFEDAIEQSEKDNLVMSTDILAIKSSKIEAATLEGRDAEITVRFEAEMISMTKDEEGVVVNGDPYPHVVKELWTFARHLGSNNPNWLLITTTSAD